MKRAQLLWLFLRLVGMLWQTVLALLIVDVHGSILARPSLRKGTSAHHAARRAPGDFLASLPLLGWRTTDEDEVALRRCDGSGLCLLCESARQPIRGSWPRLRTHTRRILALKTLSNLASFGQKRSKHIAAAQEFGRARKHPAGIFRRCRHRCADRPGDPTICASFWECAGIRQDRVHTPCIEDILEFGFVWPKPLKYSFWLARSVFCNPRPPSGGSRCLIVTHPVLCAIFRQFRHGCAYRPADHDLCLLPGVRRHPAKSRAHTRH